MESQQLLSDGATVYGAGGDKVGTMRTHGMDYIVVEKGFFFPTDYYIPVSAIKTVTGNEVYLNVGKEEALDQGWDIVPSGSLETEGIVDAERSVSARGGIDRHTEEAMSSETGAYQTNVPGTLASQDDTTAVKPKT